MDYSYLYKAKELDTGKWIEGYYAAKAETTYCFTEDYERNPVATEHYIICDEMTDWGLPNQFVVYEIDATTLCRCTGLKDSKGNYIWENDKICEGYDKGVVKYGLHHDKSSRKSDNSIVGFYIDWGKEKCYLRTDIGYWSKNHVIDVVSNIFDDKEDK